MLLANSITKMPESLQLICLKTLLAGLFYILGTRCFATSPVVTRFGPISPVKEDQIEIVLVWLISVPNVRKTLFQSPNDATRLFSAGLRFSTSLILTRAGPISSCNRGQHYSRSIRVLIVYMTSRTVHKNVFYLLNSFTSLW